MHRLRYVLTTFYLLALAALLPQAPHKPAHRATRPPTVILISIDGFRADYLDRGISPNLANLAAHGVRTQWMSASFPTVTFPNHYTLVTGLYPDHHGIVDNTMSDPSIQPDNDFTLSNREAVDDERWWDEATPLWVSVQQQGGHSATMFWPGSAAPIHGIRPDHWYQFDKNVTADQRVEHGYDNEDPLMRALFIAEGPSFGSGVVTPPFPNVDVYPLLAHILKIKPEPNDGNYAQVEPMLNPTDR